MQPRTCDPLTCVKVSMTRLSPTLAINVDVFMLFTFCESSSEYHIFTHIAGETGKQLASKVRVMPHMNSVI